MRRLLDICSMSPCRSKVLRHVGVACLWILGCSASVWAQVQPTYTFSLIGVPLEEALGMLMDQTQVDIFFETELVIGKRTYCTISDQPQEAVLRCLLQDTGLDYYRLSSGTYILSEGPLGAPAYGDLAGRVLDARTGVPLADANVLLFEADAGMATNRAGWFGFTRLKPGPYRLIATHVAYHDAADTVWVAPDTPSRFELTMEPRTVVTAPMVINGLTRRLPSENLGTSQRDAQTLLSAPTPVLMDFNTIVGVQVGDAMSDVHVQGGASGEHQYLLDGVHVFVPIQNGGFVGPFSPFALKQITIHKAGFGAQHGSHLSGVIAVEHDIAPSDETISAQVQIDPLHLNGRLNGTLGTKQGTRMQWMVAGRYGLWGISKPTRLKDRFQSWSRPDLFLLKALETETFEPLDDTVVGSPVDIGFSDIHAAVHVQREGLKNLYASVYRGHNTFGSEALETQRSVLGTLSDEYFWINQTAQLRYEWVQGHRAFAHAGMWVSNYRMEHPFTGSPFATISSHSAEEDAPPPARLQDLNQIKEIGFRTGFDYAASARHTLTSNLEALVTESDFALTIDPLGRIPVATPEVLQPIRWRWHATLEDVVALNRRMKLTLGSRLSYLHAQRRLFVEPRLAFRYDQPNGLGGAWAFRGAAGLYRQFTNQFDVASYNIAALLPSFRFWVPVGKGQRPPTAYHVAGEVLLMKEGGWEFGWETYYKHHPRWAVLNYGGLTSPTANVLVHGQGYAYGSGLSVRQKTTRSQVEASYEYAVAKSRIANRFGGQSISVPWEAPHQVRFTLDVVPRKDWTVTLRWKGIWGRSWGFRRAYYDYLEPDIETRFWGTYDLSEPEAHKLPAFSRVDVGLAYTRQLGTLGTQVRLNIINVLGRRNVTDWSLVTPAASGAPFQRISRSGTPFLPLLSVQANW